MARGGLTAVLALVLLTITASTAQATQFVNAATITINDTVTDGAPAPASPFPSQIVVGGQTGVLKWSPSI